MRLAVRRSPGSDPRSASGAIESTIRVLVVDDHDVVRSGLVGLLSAQRDFEVVGAIGDGREAVSAVRDAPPDVVVMDIAMPGLNGIDAAIQMRNAAPTTRVVLFSAHGDDAYLERILALGEIGYVLKRSNLTHLFQAVREAVAGRTYFSPVLRRRAKDAIELNGRPHRGSPTQLSALSGREREVLQMIAEGSGNKRAALCLGISVKTIEKHRQSVMRKLDLHDVTALVRFAVSTGVVECVHPDSVD